MALQNDYIGIVSVISVKLDVALGVKVKGFVLECVNGVQVRVHVDPGAVQAYTVQRFSRAGPRGRGREWATLGVHPLSWLLSNNRLEEVCSTLTKGTFSSRLLQSS